MCLSHPTFSQLIRSPNFAKRLFAIIVDEAHCISKWGDSFRKEYGELGRLRSYVPTHVPFLVTSATMTPTVLLDIHNKLDLETSKTFIINLGNDWSNITPIVVKMTGAASNLAALDFVLDEPLSNQPFRRTIIFFNTRDLAYKACERLQQLAPPGFGEKIHFLHALRTTRAKRKIMKAFRSGEIGVMCATEAAGMVSRLRCFPPSFQSLTITKGMDIPDVRRVIGFMIPSSLSIWTQRAGRVGRDKEPAGAILLVEPSVYQQRKKKNANSNESAGDCEDNDGETQQQPDSGNIDADKQHVKKVEPGMRSWIETRECDCRRDVSDKHFNNPKRTSDPTVPCCDLCVLKKSRTHPSELAAAEV